MFLEVLTPDEQLFAGEVISVTASGSDGNFEVLTNHAPFISSLKSEGEIIIKTLESETQSFQIKGGVVEVLQNRMIVLTEQ